MGNVFLINSYYRVAAGVGGALLGVAAGFLARGRGRARLARGKEDVYFGRHYGNHALRDLIRGEKFL